jgi:hypothetical protein
VAGRGRRSVTFKALYHGKTVAMKVYRPEFIRKYRDRYGVNIGVFEMSRNRAFCEVPELREYAAQPVAVLGEDGAHSLIFLQEFIHGLALTRLGKKEGGLPDSVLEAGERIIRIAELNGLHDLDLFYRNILCRQADGVWQPVIHDFNLMPQHLFPPNPFLKLALKLGVRKPSHRDYRCIAQWRAYSSECRSAGGTVSGS